MYRVSTWDPIDERQWSTRGYVCFWRVRGRRKTRRGMAMLVHKMESYCYDRYCSIMVERLTEYGWVCCA